METSIDFLQYLEPDMGLKILMRLDDPADLVRVGAVSQSWRNFVIKSRLSKQLCFTKFPQLSSTPHIIGSNPGKIDNTSAEISNATETKILERDHKVYASLVQALSRSKVSSRDSIAGAISASSTDHYPDESIVNTLNPESRTSLRGPSYWSSKGYSDPNVPETLTYRLIADISIVTEIDIQPFQAYWEWDHPIYSAESVRFRMGHPRSKNLNPNHPDEYNFVWTYTSPVFPMKQENRLQQFKLPEPILCIGGLLQIELLGRVQMEELDGLYYICICHVRALGLPLKPAFGIEILKPSGEFMLRYDMAAINSLLGHASNDDN